ncbi:MAG: non-canonical purine NTP pyrophosphatase [Clostridiales bacterium]|nr:non-canonical purine NTP pyrophosphatase [Clostridiales bacterium]
MDILIGTTNPSKVKRFASLLNGYDVALHTLQELCITEEPEETGSTPEENALQKAAFYGRFSDYVICNDAGLYFDGLPMRDPRQPGLHVRSPQGARLDDEEMITYYSSLIRSLGARCWPVM